MRYLISFIDSRIEATRGDGWLRVHIQSKGVKDEGTKWITYLELNVVSATCVDRWNTRESPSEIAEPQPPFDTSCKSVDVSRDGQGLIDGVLV